MAKKTKTYRQNVRREGRKQFIKGIGQQVKAGFEIAPLVTTVATLGAGAGAGTFGQAAKAVGQSILKNPLGTAAGLGGLASAGAAIKDKAAGMWNEMAGLAKWIFNHPEWYVRFLIANTKLNYSFRTTNVIDTSNNVDPIFPQAIIIEYQLNEPFDSVAAEVLSQSIQANLLSLRRARGYGYSEYTAKDLANYLRNVRIVVCETGEIARLIKLFNNYDIVNTKMPYSLLAAADPAYSTYTAVDTEYVNLAGIKHEFTQLLNSLSVNCMGSIPMFDRTLWLASNVFADTKGRKVVPYIPRHALTDYGETPSGIASYNSYAYYDPSRTVVTANLNIGGSIATRMNNLRSIVYNAFINDPIANQITSDLLYLYGNKAGSMPEYFSHLINTVDEPIPLIHDEYLLSQLQNAHVIGYTHHDYNPTTTASAGFYDHHVHSSFNYAITLMTNWTNATYSGTRVTTTNTWEDFYVANTTLDPAVIDTGMQISMLRLQAMLPTNYRYFFRAEAGGGGVSYLYYGVINPSGTAVDTGFDKSETVTRIRVVTPISSSQFTETTIIYPGNASIQLIMDASSISIASSLVEKYKLSQLAWGIADWMPRVITPGLYEYDDSIPAFGPIMSHDPEVFLWDINQYAPYSVNEVSAMDQDAVQSLYIWAWNGGSLIGPSIKTLAKTDLTKGNSGRPSR